MAKLPAPLTVTDEYLAAVHDELIGLRADLARRGGEQAGPDEPGRVELLEPEPRTGSKRTRTRTRS